jgi:hypothetical protein
MDGVIFEYATNVTIIVLLCMLVLVAIREGLKMMDEIQILARKILKRTKE